jgi:chaperonin GroEL
VRAPSFGDRRKDVMRDIALLTGGQVISEEMGRRLVNTKLSDLGSARHVVARKESMILLDGHGSKAGIQERMRELRAQLLDASSDFDREKLRERLAKLAGGVAVIKVGATTELEQKYLKTRVEDAMAATRSAIEEGMLPGGGVALLNAADTLDALEFTGDAATGVSILRRALEEPLRQIAINAGHNGAVIVDGVQRAQQEYNNKHYGYNVLTSQYEDMIESGIIDPAKVVRSALQNATSIAVMILTTEVMVADVPEKIDPRPLLGEF